MKLIPNKGYVQIERVNGDALNDSPYMYNVVAVAQDSSLCEVGDRIIVQHVTLSTIGLEIAAEEDILAWVEDDNDSL